VAAGLDIVGVPTSEKTAALARELGIRLSDLAEHERIDLTIDGADEVERGTLHLVKGLGGALLREKIVASATARLVIVADESKVVDRLRIHEGPIPIEVAIFGWQSTVLLRVRACGVCRTDLHIVEGELAPRRRPDSRASDCGRDGRRPATGRNCRRARAWACRWLGGVDGELPWYCRTAWRISAMRPTFTGYTVDGGYAEYAWRARISCFRCRPVSTICTRRRCCAPASSASAACAWPAWSRASGWDCSDSARRRTLAIAVLHAWNCKVYVATRGESHRALAESLGATWVGA
jgi:hypothetical protein